MNKREKLRICNISLLIAALLVLISGILLEIADGNGIEAVPYTSYVILHIVFVAIMALLVTWHLYLHFGKNKWWQKANNLKSHVTTGLFKLALLIAVTGLISLICFCIVPEHSTFGGIHGKLGFVFIVVAIGHTAKRRKWFTKNRATKNAKPN